MTTERLSTEKTTLGFFGAMCGVLVSQIPELRLGETYNLLQASGSLLAVVTLVTATTYIRRGLGKTSTEWVLFSVILFIGALVLLMIPEIYSALEGGIDAMPIERLRSASLKILLLVFLGIWSAFSFFDKGEPV